MAASSSCIHTAKLEIIEAMAAPSPNGRKHDECRIRTANAPANFATIKHMAGNLLRHGAGKQSLRVKRRLAAWDDDYLASPIMAG